MPPPDHWRLLGAIVGALVVLLLAGVAAAGYLLWGRSAVEASWKQVLAQFAARSPWRWRDLLFLVLLVGTAQALRTCLSPSVAWDALAFQGVLLAGLAWRARGKRQAYGVHAPIRAICSQAVLRWLAVLPLLWFVAFSWQAGLTLCGQASDFQEAIRLFLESDDLGQRAQLALFAVVLAPIAEEGLFRGILLPLLVRRTGAVAGLALATLCFAGLHANLGTFVPLAVLSSALALAYVRTGTLWVPIGMHALFNAANLALLLALHRAGAV